jgi:hypothetical protein
MHSPLTASMKREKVTNTMKKRQNKKHGNKQSNKKDN